MSRGSDRNSSSWASMPPEPAFNHTSAASTHFTLPPMRYSGDGFDMRTPIMSDSANIIDLTEEPDTPRSLRSHANAASAATSHRPRPPRFPRNIIDLDLDNNSDSHSGGMADASPEVEILGSAPSAPGRRQQYRPRGLVDIASTLRPTTYTSDTRAGPNGTSPFFLNYIRNIVRQTNTSRINRQNINALLDEEELHRHDTHRLYSRRYPPPHFEREPPSTRIDEAFAREYSRIQLPEILQYDTQGFPMGDVPPSTPVYDAPPPPRDGFTRSPTEDQQVICPNCHKELGTGNDEMQQSVWVVKGCGHVCV